MRFYSDDHRHLVCWPYSIENLHAMAKHLGIKRHFFHMSSGKGRWQQPTRARAHYDIPARRIEEIRAKTVRVSGRDVLSIIKGVLPEHLK